MGIGTRVQYTEVPLAPGNVISNGKSSQLSPHRPSADCYRTRVL